MRIQLCVRIDGNGIDIRIQRPHRKEQGIDIILVKHIQIIIGLIGFYQSRFDSLIPQDHIQGVHIGIQTIIDGSGRLLKRFIQIIFFPADHLAADLPIAHRSEKQHGNQTDQRTDRPDLFAEGQIVKKQKKLFFHDVSDVSFFSGMPAFAR